MKRENVKCITSFLAYSRRAVNKKFQKIEKSWFTRLSTVETIDLMIKVVVQNSYSKVEGSLPDFALDVVRQVLTYKNDIESERGQLFYQMKLAKRYNNKKQYHACMARLKALEASEFVCLYKDGTFPTGLLNIVVEALTILKVEFKMDDQRIAPDQTAILRWNNVPHNPRYYQKEMIDLGLKHGRGVFEAAVGSGKSLIMGYMIKEISVPSLVIVPSVGLSGQLYNDFASWFGHQNVDIVNAQKARKQKRPKPICISTVQSLASMKKTGEFKEFASNFEALHVDELHHAGASSYTKLLEDMEHVYYRYGYTGTFLRNDNKTLEMWSFLSNKLYSFPAHRAIAEGFLTPLEVNVYTMTGKPNNKYPKEYENHYCANPELLEKVAQIIQAIEQDKQVLILVKQKDKCGLVIHEYLNSIGIDNTYISGDNSRDEINGTITSFNEKKIRILIGSSVIGEGIDVRSTDHLIMCQGGKSEITMVQAIGRAIRLFEGKKIAYVHDFRFEGSNFMEGHCDDRIEIYERNFNCKINHY